MVAKTRKKKADPHADVARDIDTILLHLAASRDKQGDTFDIGFSPLVAGLPWQTDIISEFVDRRHACGITAELRPEDISPTYSAQSLLACEMTKGYQLISCRVAPKSKLRFWPNGIMPSGLVMEVSRYRLSREGIYSASHSYATHREGIWMNALGERSLTQIGTATSGHGGRFVTHGVYRDVSDDLHQSICVVGVGYMFCREMWTMRVYPDGCRNSIVLATNPVGVRELLRFRNLESGLTRRQSLLHWVRSHKRSIPTDQDAVIDVRKHLRGKRECLWYDLRVVVSESESDRGALDA